MSFKLIILAGPINKGASFSLMEGENSLGRDSSASVVLEDAEVSKRHCIFSVIGNEIELLDAGSSNGTFVNGILVKKQKLKLNDKISIGPFVAALVYSDKDMLDEVPVAFSQNNDSIENQDLNTMLPKAVDGNSEMNLADEGNDETTNKKSSGRNKSLLYKLRMKFDDVVLPVMHDLHEKYEWTTVVTVLFVGYVFLNIGFSIHPLLQTSKKSVVKEAKRRAVYIVKQIAERNRKYIIEGNEAQLTVSFTEADPHVIDAVIISMKGRVMSPIDKLNESYGNPVVLKHRNKMLRGGQQQWKLHYSTVNNVFIVSIPIMVYSDSKGINVPGAIASVIFSIRGIALDIGTIGVIYFETLITSVIFGFLFLYLLYHVSVHPIRVLNNDMDDALKGNLQSIPIRYKYPQLDVLIGTINAALSKIPSIDIDEGEKMNASDIEQSIIDNMMVPLRDLAMVSRVGIMILDKEFRVRVLSPEFEDMSGIHEMEAIGDLISNVSRDEAFSSLIEDMTTSCVDAGSDGSKEEFEFTSGLYKVNCIAIFGLPNQIEAYLFQFEKDEDFA